jgi:amino acid transporter
MATPPYPLNPEPLKKSWLERNPLWKIPLGCLILLLLLGLVGFVLIALISGTFHRSDVYKMAMARAAANAQVRERIGQPIESGWFIFGALHLNGSTGDANFPIPISGRRGKGQIRVVAYKAGVWRFTFLQVYVEGQMGSIDLLGEATLRE